VDINSEFKRIFRNLEEEPIDFDPSSEKALKIIDRMAHKGAKPDSTFSSKHDVISKESCQKLVKYMDDSIAADVASGVELPMGTSKEMEPGKESWTPFDGGIDNQYNKKLYADDIVNLVGAEETHKILDFFHQSVGEDMTIDCMYLARHGNPDNELYYVPWHIDDYFTMEITLNDDYDGGDVLHLTGEGAQRTEARTGTATAHGPDIVHGITPNTNGAKYMLILKHHIDRPDKEGVIRISREMVDELAMNQD